MVGSKTRKFLLIVLPFFCLTLIGISVFANLRNESSDPTAGAEESAVNQTISEGEHLGIPRIVSIDPQTAIAGEQFVYYVRIVDSDTPQTGIIMGLVDGPEWLKIDPSNFMLFGTPDTDSLGTHNVVISISDGKNRFEHSFNLLVIQSQDE